MRTIVHILFVALAAMLTFGGCATKRGEVALQVPSSSMKTAATGKEVLIRTVADLRRFEATPGEPNTPSLDPQEAQNDAIRARAIARKRNGYGKALGDILLKEGQTVASVVGDAVAEAFVQRGYTVVATPRPSTTIVDVDVAQFWSWMTPGFWAITLSTEISTPIRIQKPDGSSSETVYVKATGNYQTAAGGNWVEVMQQALGQYVEAVKGKI